MQQPDRKRKEVSPPTGGGGPAAKRRGAVLTTAAPPVSVPAEESGLWEQVAEETGWGLADCLSHKITFAKRADAKAKVEPLVLHVKRLRAAGWHLLDQRER